MNLQTNIRHKMLPDFRQAAALARRRQISASRAPSKNVCCQTHQKPNHQNLRLLN
jgi:hypothetical protein